MDVFVARQPIFDTAKSIFGYELLFREGLHNAFPDIDGDTATNKLLSHSFFTIGVNQLVGNKMMFINFTQNLLVNRLPTLFPKDRLMVEILEDVEPENHVIEACAGIKKAGYTLVLDDFLLKPELIPLVMLADMIKIDFRETSPRELSLMLEKLTPFPVKLLAEKIETYEEFENAKQIGFDYFQGFFFSKPEILTARDIAPQKLTMLQLAAEVNQQDMDLDRLEELISREVAVPYKLLRYMNSAYFRRAQEITSLKHALVMLGQQEIKKFISVVTTAELASDKPAELIKASIIRARFCELIGQETSTDIPHSELFIIGLFSLIDAILDNDMDAIMNHLPLSDSIKETLVQKKGDGLMILKLVISYESADWKGFAEMSGKLGLDAEKIPYHYLEALSWADSYPSL